MFKSCPYPVASVARVLGRSEEAIYKRICRTSDYHDPVCQQALKVAKQLNMVPVDLKFNPAQEWFVQRLIKSGAPPEHVAILLNCTLGFVKKYLKECESQKEPKA